jgi:hypothetical protein
VANLALPPTVQAVLAARVDRLTLVLEKNGGVTSDLVLDAFHQISRNVYRCMDND